MKIIKLEFNEIVFVLILIMSTNLTIAAELISYVGDPDGLGLNIPDGGIIPSVPVLFDNRSIDEMNATNGAQGTDLSTTGGGFTIDAHDFQHAFELPSGAVIEMVSIVLGVGGLESNDNNPNTQGITEDELLVDGVIVPEAFEALVLSGYEFDANYRIDLTSDLFPLFLDGMVTIQIDANALGTFGSGAEPVFLDYSQVIIQFSLLPPVSVPVNESNFMILLLFLILIIAYKKIILNSYNKCNSFWSNYLNI